MPSLYRKESRMDPHDSSMQNLAKAKASPRYHPPRPWRSKEESQMIRRYVHVWMTCRDRNRPSGRDWAKQLGISHTWLQKLVGEFHKDPDRVLLQSRRAGDPTLAQFARAREYTQQMRERGELRPLQMRKRRSAESAA